MTKMISPKTKTKTYLNISLQKEVRNTLEVVHLVGRDSAGQGWAGFIHSTATADVTLACMAGLAARA
jgi:hypothetical protein